MDQQGRTLQDKVAQLRGLKDYLQQQLLGQEEACDKICHLIWQGELDLQPAECPRGSALLIGPTGTGKTAMAKAVASYLYPEDTEHRLHCYDMANFKHADSLPLLIGSPGQRGLWGGLLDQLEQQPSILLFDEIEKAHPVILPLFLSMLGTASLGCNDGKRRDLRSHYLFFTSNLASADMVHMEHLPHEAMQRFVSQQMETVFSPELTARLQTRVLFRPINRNTLSILARRETTQQIDQISARMGVHIQLYEPEQLYNWIHNRVSWEYSQHRLGARMIRNTVRLLLQQSLIHYLLQHNLLQREHLWLSVTDNQLMLTHQPPVQSHAPNRLIRPSNHAAQQTNQPVNTQQGNEQQ